MKQYASGIVATIVFSVFLLLPIQNTNAQDQKAKTKTVLSAETEVFVGIWEGFLQIGPKKVQVDLEIKARNDKTLSCFIQMPLLGIPGSDAQNFSISGRNLKVSLIAYMLPFDGILSDNNLEIAGTATPDAKNKMDVTFKKVDKITTIKRVQTPTPPYPYEEKEVEFVNKKDGTKLAGTVTYPKGQGPFPAAILVSGATPHNRDEEGMGGHRFFHVLADDLTKRGIAVLRYDDRGVAQSTGDYESASIFDFADDAEAGLDFLATLPFIEKGNIGYIGHSEGGSVAQIIASRRSEPAFIVLLAGPVIPSADVLKYQYKLAKQGGNPATKALVEIAEKALEVVLKEENVDLIREKVTSLFSVPGFPEQLRKEWIENFSKPNNILSYRLTPSDFLVKINCPILALGGDKDVAVPYKENLEALKQIMDKNGKTNYRTVEFKNINHFFQTTTNGAFNMAPLIDETMSPLVMQTIGEWILKTTGKKFNYGQ